MSNRPGDGAVLAFPCCHLATLAWHGNPNRHLEVAALPPNRTANCHNVYRCESPFFDPTFRRASIRPATGSQGQLFRRRTHVRVDQNKAELTKLSSV
jgi:hypothetical protein